MARFVFAVLFLLFFSAVCAFANQDPLTNAENLQSQEKEQALEDQITDLEQAKSDSEKASQEARSQQDTAKRSQAERLVAMKKMEHQSLVSDIVLLFSDAKFVRKEEDVPPQETVAENLYHLSEIPLSYESFRHQVFGGGVILKIYSNDKSALDTMLASVQNYLTLKKLFFHTQAIEKGTYHIAELKCTLFSAY